MAKGKANGDGTPTDVHLVLNGKGRVGKVIAPTRLRQITTLHRRGLDGERISDPSLKRAELDQWQVRGRPTLARGTEQRLRRLYSTRMGNICT